MAEQEQAKKSKDERKQTVVLQKKSVKKGSVKYETENAGGLAVDNLYVYKDSPVLKGFGASDKDDFPDEITITIRAGGKKE
jgi:hypothetical protein